MTKSQRLYRILFLVSIVVLLTNDLYLKYQYPSYLTGKLSDFAGLFAFPYFFSALFPKKKVSIYVLSGVLFVFWKSEFSQPIIDFAHSYSIGINRTIDYSDLVALLILPVSYLYWHLPSKPFLKPSRFFKPIIIVISCFAFIATSLPQHNEELLIQSGFSVSVNASYKRVKAQLNPYMDYYTIQIPEKKAHIQTSIKIDSVSKTHTEVTLDSIKRFNVMGNAFIFSSGINKDAVEYMRTLTQNDIETLFSKQIKDEFTLPTNCENYKTGNFKYMSFDTETTVVRTDSIQREYTTKDDVVIVTTVDWISDCEYVLTYKDVENYPRKDAVLGKKIYVTIIETDSTSYTAIVNSSTLKNARLKFFKIKDI